MKIPANLGFTAWGGPQAGFFRPLGRVVWGHRATDLGAVYFELENTLAARLFVGFSVANEPRWSLDDVILVVREVRERQAPDDPSASFIIQKGIYKYKATGQVVEEDGAQVVIIDTRGLSYEDFRREIVELGEEIVKRLEQELVVVEIQRDGLVVKTLGVGP